MGNLSKAALLLAVAMTALTLQGCASDSQSSSSGSGDQTATAAPSGDPSTDGASATEGPAPFTKAITKQLIASLLERGDGLYAEVSGLPDDTPSTQMGAAELVNGDQGPIGSFYAKDRAFQADLPKANPGKDAPNLVSAASDLAEFETFAYSTAAAVASCNAADARRDLKVAKAFLDEAHRDLNGTAPDDWSPPDTAENDTESEECSQ